MDGVSPVDLAPGGRREPGTDSSSASTLIQRRAAGSPARPKAAASVLLLLAGIALAVVLTLSLREWLLHTQFVLFFALVIVTTRAGGLRLGAAAVVLGIAAFELFVHGPIGTIALESALFVRGAALGIVGGLAVWLMHRSDAARQLAEARARESAELASRLEEQATELELQVSESEAMAAELEDLNQQLEEQTDAAQRAARRAERLHAVAARLLTVAAGEPVLRAVAHEARHATEARGAAVIMPRSNGRPGLVATSGHPAEVGGDAAALLGCQTPARLAMQTGAPVWVESRAELRERFPEVVEHTSSACGAWVALPLQGAGAVLGVIALDFDAEGEFRPEDRSFMTLLAQQCAQSVERAMLQERGVRARVRAEFAERRLALLAEASQRLAASLDYQTSLGALAGLTVPDLADCCAIYLVDDSGGLRLVASAHHDHSREETRRELEGRRPGGLEAAVQRVVATGRPDLLVDFPHAPLDPAARDNGRYAAAAGFGLHSLLTVPIAADDRICGGLSLGLSASGREFGEPDITLAVELGRRAGQAVENARLYAAAQHASQAKTDFLAVMSHELRTPLNAIIGYSDLLLLGVPDGVPEHARRQVERIRSASDSLLHQVEEVLSFSRIEAGKEELRISPVDVSAIATEVAAMVEPLAAEKALELRTEVPPGIRVVSDERKIRQILTNLVSNALKFTEQGSVELRATMTETEVRIDVSDTGIGISPQYVERIFEPFWQVEQVSTRRFGGTGLGLGVARKLARLLEGRLEVSSEEGRGSTFSLVLPRHTPGTARVG